MAQTRNIISTNLAPPIHSVSWGAERYSDFLQDTGYDGLELHPLRSVLIAQSLMGSQKADNITRSYHQSFRGESAATMFQYALSDRTEFARCLGAFVALERKR